MKKIIGITSSVLLLTIGGAYYYGVQQFDQNARNLVTTIEKAKPALSFDSIEIDKYRFQIRLKNLKVDTSSFHDDLVKLVEDTNTKSTVNPEPMLMTTNDDLSLSYNPLTKTAHLTAQNHEPMIQFTQGNLTKGLKISFSGHTMINIKFTDHPNFRELDGKKLMELLKTIRNVSIQSPKYIMTDAQTAQPLLSSDSSDMSLDVILPENAQENGSIHILSQVNNQVVEKELYDFVGKILENIFTGTIKEQMTIGLQILPKMTMKKTEKMGLNLSIKMSDLKEIMDGKMDVKNGFPKISGSFNDHCSSNLLKLKTDVDFETDSKSIAMKFDMSGKCEPEFRQYYGAYFGNVISMIRKGANNEPPALDIPLLDEKTMIDIMPDFASLGNFHLTSNIKGNKDFTEGQFDLNIEMDQYSVNTKGNYGKEKGGKIEAELINLDQIVTDMRTYIDRLFAHKEIKDSLHANAQNDMHQNIEMGKMTLEAMGKKEEKDGKTILKIELPLPPQMIPASGAAVG